MMSKTDKYLWLTSAILLAGILIYQLFKNFSPYIERKDIRLEDANYFALVIFSLAVIFILFFAKNINKQRNGIITIFLIFAVLSVSYINFGKRIQAWKGSDAAHHLYAQSKMINTTGIINYIANYNTYGRPRKEIREQALKYLNMIGMGKEAEEKWSKDQDIPLLSYTKDIHHFMSNPPLSHIIHFLWMKLAGFSQRALNLFILVLFFINLGLLYRLFRLLFHKPMAMWLCLAWISTPAMLKRLHPPALEPILALFLILALYMFYMGEKRKSGIFCLSVGLLMGLAMYIKFSAIPIYLVFTVLYGINGLFQRSYRGLFMFIFGSLSVILLFLFLGYNPIYTIVTGKLWTQYSVQHQSVPFLCSINFPLHIGFPIIVLMMMAIRENATLADSRLKIFERNENLLYVLTFILTYIIYFSVGDPNRYVAPYLPFLLIFIGRYIRDKNWNINPGRYNYIFIFNFIFIILTEFL